MNGGRHPRKALWRWRSNPLRRRDDVREAWIVLTVWVVVAVGGTITGLMTAHAAEEVFAQERVDRQAVSAVLLADVPVTASDIGGASDRASAKVRWTAPDGATRTGTTLVESGQKAGATVTIWTDGQGDLRSEPPTPTESAVEAGVLGTAAGLGLSGLVFGVGQVGRWWLDRRRIEQWGREWTLVGPLWSHKTG